MKHLLTVLFLFISLSIFSQVTPKSFRVDNTPDFSATGDAIYTMEDTLGGVTGHTRKIYLQKLRDSILVPIRLEISDSVANANVLATALTYDDSIYAITDGSLLAGIASPNLNDMAINTASDTLWIRNASGWVSFSGGGGLNIIESNTTPSSDQLTWVDTSGTQPFKEVKKYVNGGWRVTGYYNSITDSYTDNTPLTIVISGQSNATGTTSGNPGDNSATDSRVLAWNGSGWVLATLGNAPFNVDGSNNIGFQFAKKLAEESNRHVQIIFNGNSGDAIIQWITGSNFTDLKTEITNADVSKIDVFLWHQGESDYLQTTSYYESGFSTLKDSLRLQSWFPSTTPIIVGGLLEGGTNFFQDAYLETTAYDNDPYVNYASSDDLSGYDNYHFTGTALDTLAQRYYGAYKETPSKSLWKKIGNDTYFSTKVGINTAPVYNFDVSGGAETFPARIYNAQAGVIFGGYSSKMYMQSINAAGDGVASMVIGGYNGVAIPTTELHSTNIYLRGYVGIGTATPNAALQVASGGIKITDLGANNFLTSVSGGLIAGASFSSINISSLNNDTGGGLGLLIDGGSATYVNQTGDNFGIGMTNPSAKLGLGAALGYKLSLYDNGSTKYGFGIQNNLMEFIVPATADDFAFGVGTSGSLTRVLTIEGTGNLGLGITSPISKAHIYESTTNVSTTAGLTIEQGSTGDAIAQFLLTGGQRWVIGTDNSDNDKFKIAHTADAGTNTDFTIDPATGDILMSNNVVVSKTLASTMTSTTLGAAATTLAITSNTVKVTGDGGGNTLATITGGVSGQILTLIFVDANVTITDTAATTANTVNLSAAFTSTADDTITLIHDGNKWFETSRSVN
jgi:hypothetical protein